MNGIDIFLWGIAPYISFTMLIAVTIIRRVHFARTWSSKSSEFLKRKQERVANPLFHLSILFVFFGHVGGVLVPHEVTDALGVSEEMYHMAAFGMGGLFGVLLGIALILLIRRRFGGNERMKANTSTSDKVLYVVLTATIVMGLVATFSNASGAFNYRESLSPWFRSLFTFQPDIALMAQVPLAFKIHMCCWMILFAVLPFTRLVHMFSGITAPFKYARRKAVLYRARKHDVRANGARDLEFPDAIILDRK